MFAATTRNRPPVPETALTRVIRRLESHAYYDGEAPSSLAVSPNDYRELMGYGEFAADWRVTDFTIRGVKIEIDHGPYPWGEFPEHD